MAHIASIHTQNQKLSFSRLNTMAIVLISDKTSYHKISWILEAAGLVVKIFAWKFDRHIGNSAADVPVIGQGDQTILKTNLAVSRLCEILR